MDQFFVKNPVIKIRISEKVAEAIKPIYDENSDNDETLLCYKSAKFKEGKHS